MLISLVYAAGGLPGFIEKIHYEKFINSLHDIYVLYTTLYSRVIISTYLNISMRVNYD